MSKMNLFSSYRALKNVRHRSARRANLCVLCCRTKSCRGHVTRVLKSRLPLVTSLTSPSSMRTLMRLIAPSKQLWKQFPKTHSGSQSLGCSKTWELCPLVSILKTHVFISFNRHLAYPGPNAPGPQQELCV